MTSIINQFSVIELLEDLNENIKKGMTGTVLEIYDFGNYFEVEFVKKDGTNYSFQNEFAFQIEKEKLHLKC